MPNLRLLFFVAFACSIGSRLAVACQPETREFTTDGRVVLMEIRCFDQFLGTRLTFYSDTDPRKEICLAGSGELGTCPNHFVGAVATAKFTVRGVSGKLRGRTSIREYVTVIAQSPDLPPRAPFESKRVLAGGVITDIQAFGYDEGDIAKEAREAERTRARGRLWRICRQELFLNDGTVPFAVITWRYTLDSVDIVSLQGGLGDTAPQGTP